MKHLGEDLTVGLAKREELKEKVTLEISRLKCSTFDILTPRICYYCNLIIQANALSNHFVCLITVPKVPPAS